MNKMGERGYLYIAYGEAFTKEALMSIESLRRFTSLPIAVFTDQKKLVEESAEKLSINLIGDIVANHLRAKVDYMDQSPFVKTVFLDTDTVVVRNCDDMFDLLERFDVAIVNDYARKREKYSKTVPEYGEIPYAFSEANSGVVAFNSSTRTNTFLKMWKEYFYQYFKQTNGWDQISFRISLWKSNVRIHHMPFEYNVRSAENREKQKRYKHEFGEDHMESRIIHIHYDSEIHRGQFNIENLEQLEKIVKEKAVDY
tara:strand:- start:1246 stop:2010 length:765 start_codon:yes stop_codon:yes gene_type:complete